mmetsp:Transcript_9061/g.13199  ORF Transcript_9061/g.13199 Transcript_9061/m.13199 type:complete len:108 (-) Transcript_9061:571-894(-)
MACKSIHGAMLELWTYSWRALQACVLCEVCCVCIHLTAKNAQSEPELAPSQQVTKENTQNRDQVCTTQLGNNEKNAESSHGCCRRPARLIHHSTRSGFAAVNRPMAA